MCRTLPKTRQQVKDERQRGGGRERCCVPGVKRATPEPVRWHTPVRIPPVLVTAHFPESAPICGPDRGRQRREGREKERGLLIERVARARTTPGRNDTVHAGRAILREGCVVAGSLAGAAMGTQIDEISR